MSDNKYQQRTGASVIVTCNNAMHATALQELVSNTLLHNGFRPEHLAVHVEVVSNGDLNAALEANPAYRHRAYASAMAVLREKGSNALTEEERQELARANVSLAEALGVQSYRPAFAPPQPLRSPGDWAGSPFHGVNPFNPLARPFLPQFTPQPIWGDGLAPLGAKYAGHRPMVDTVQRFDAAFRAPESMVKHSANIILGIQRHDADGESPSVGYRVERAKVVVDLVPGMIKVYARGSAEDEPLVSIVSAACYELGDAKRFRHHPKDPPEQNQDDKFQPDQWLVITRDSCSSWLPFSQAITELTHGKVAEYARLHAPDVFSTAGEHYKGKLFSQMQSDCTVVGHWLESQFLYIGLSQLNQE